MREAVDLDDESGVRTVKVDDVRWDWMLLAELQAELLSAQLFPQQDFGERHFPAQLASGVCLRAMRKPGAPSTALRAIPLPVPGRMFAPYHAAHPAYSLAQRSASWAMWASQLPRARSRTRAM